VAVVVDGAGSVGAGGAPGTSGLVSARGAVVGAACGGVSSCFTFFFARFALFFLFVLDLGKIQPHLETIADPR
jgi:hypothetical protein